MHCHFIKNYPKSLGFEFVKETILPLMKATIPSRQIKFIYETHRYSNCCIITFKRKTINHWRRSINDFLIEMIQENYPKWK
jgi:hypothetical protein